MVLALSHARLAIGVSDPNPRVGCVLLDAAGRFIAIGHTQAAGQAHAEIMAIRQAQALGVSLRGATALVTLEPCSHHGRTPPCCDALIEAGVARVVAAVKDPNPLVAGQGLARLQAAGIQTESGLMANEAQELNIGFFSRMQRQRPFVRMKIAATLDGRTALPEGQSQWITGPDARRDGHLWRKRAGAVLTGIGTVRDDNPRLDVRLVETERQPLRVVVDSRLEISAQARILAPPGEVLVAHALGTEAAAAWAASARQADTPGPDLVSLPDHKNKVDLPALLLHLGQRGINEVHVEAGAKLNASLLQAGCVDELLLYMAPKLLGDGRALADLGALPSLDMALEFQWHEVHSIGGDLRLRLRPAYNHAHANITRT
ncbi:MAG: bifunctional diaminohydroxyphosphoribosylaminopyrimidine deaminase/5-amino-6-(5-phosphoribosylamino)uracil reductase RibD [Pelomonas sp.]|nr:bifunctional diaminohydroxyphosphoribosylaminopyrimidine deaminase/5-amino-6-(5-phosphoribosylamino)uracil reductase RibD [Roseateles sp.]MBV8469956.1 bifunctional diaminohydroxyphosphoribosylaminopyrimidine deaminase/5-amino-6-(5-phosphoribosylamino)uracil reductase RibD [Burkholderiaceae bacterium]MBV8604606.1 bifunctional diaminohydroxyphosphoribosylaminopyrimidine deaminase/5-amino-6-(5-phosphoribosylamino)uracil reductase RibD [Roseateles sp.]